MRSLIIALVLLAVSAQAQETVILQTTPPTRQQRFNQAMENLNQSLHQLGEANRQQQALGLQQGSLELERKKFELEVLDRAIRFDKEYPGDPNPYREFLRSLAAPAPAKPAAKSEIKRDAIKEATSREKGLAMTAVVTIFVVMVGAVAVSQD